MGQRGFVVMWARVPEVHENILEIRSEVPEPLWARAREIRKTILKQLQTRMVLRMLAKSNMQRRHKPKDLMEPGAAALLEAAVLEGGNGGTPPA